MVSGLNGRGASKCMENNVKNKLVFGLVCFAATFAIANSANAKPAKCEISWYGSRYSGPCDFTSRRGGSFDLSLPGNTYATHETPPYITIEITAPGQALLGWMTPTGKDQPPEEPLRRDPKRLACWVGQEVRICA